jgi:hypothetical protein
VNIINEVIDILILRLAHALFKQNIIEQRIRDDAIFVVFAHVITTLNSTWDLIKKKIASNEEDS